MSLLSTGDGGLQLWKAPSPEVTQRPGTHRCARCPLWEWAVLSRTCTKAGGRAIQKEEEEKHGEFVTQLSFPIRALMLAISGRQLSGHRLAAGVSPKLPCPLEERSGSPCRARGQASLVCLPSCLLQSASLQPSAPSHSSGFLCCVCLIQHSSSSCCCLLKTTLAGDDSPLWGHV